MPEYTGIGPATGRRIMKVLQDARSLGQSGGFPGAGGVLQIAAVDVGDEVYEHEGDWWSGAVVLLQKGGDETLQPCYVAGLIIGDALVTNERYACVRQGDETFNGETRPSFRAIITQTPGTVAHECELPTSATQLAEESCQGDGDPIAGLAAWTHDDVLLITLDDECCHVSFNDSFCSEDGTHTQCQRYTIHFPFKVKLSHGPVEESCPAPDYNKNCDGTCGGDT